MACYRTPYAIGREGTHQGGSRNAIKDSTPGFEYLGPSASEVEMIRLDRVSMGFDAPILDRVSMHLPMGASLGIMGTGGVGKSLLLKLCCGLLQPTEGEVWIDGVLLQGSDEGSLATLRSGIGMAFQNSALFDFMNDQLLFIVYNGVKR